MRPGAVIKAARDAAGLKGEELAARAGISLRSLWALESGTQSPHVTTLSAVCDALDLPLETRGAMLTVEAWADDL